MTVSAQTPVISYTASGSATVFTYPFRILVSTDLEVYLNGIESATGFTVTGVGDLGGGTVVFATPPSAGTLVRLQRNIPRTRTTDYVEGGALAANTLDDDFDRLVLMLQDIEAGTQVVTENFASSIKVSSYTATEGQTLFTLTDSYTLGANTLEVMVNGASQILDVDYTETSSTSITFTTGLNAGDVVVARVLQIYPGVLTTAGLVGYGATTVEAALDASAATLATHTSKLAQTVSVKDFGAVGDGVADDTAAIAAAWAASKSLVFPAGTYKVSSLPNFAYNGARLHGVGEVWLNFVGTGNALVLDSGSTPGSKNYNIVIENIGINGTATCTHGVYMRGITHSTLRRIRTRNVVTAALRAEFLVSNLFDEFTHSGNEAGMTILTLNGVVLEKRGVGEQCSDNTWNNIVIEGTSGDGLLLNEAAMNTFIGGTSEGNGYGGGAGGIFIGANSFGNTFIGMDMEHNGVLGDATSYHVKDYGLRTKFVNVFCDSALSGLFWVAGGNSCSIDGGQIADLQVDAAAKNFTSIGMAYTGAIADSGSDSRHIQSYSILANAVIADSIVQTGTWTPVPTGLATTGVPAYSGTYQKIGTHVSFVIQITNSGGGGSQATAGATSFNLPFTLGGNGTCIAASAATGIGFGTGIIAASAIYVPTWASNAHVVITGTFTSL